MEIKDTPASRAPSAAAHTGSPSGALPTTRRELLALHGELAPEATATRLGDALELGHAGMHLLLSPRGGVLHFEEWIDESVEDDDGEPATAPGEVGTITTPRALALRLGKLLEVEEAVAAAADPIAYLRERAETGVSRG